MKKSIKKNKSQLPITINSFIPRNAYKNMCAIFRKYYAFRRRRNWFFWFINPIASDRIFGSSTSQKYYIFNIIAKGAIRGWELNWTRNKIVLYGMVDGWCSSSTVLVFHYGTGSHSTFDTNYCSAEWMLQLYSHEIFLPLP